MYKQLFTKAAQKDWKRLCEGNLSENAKRLLDLIREEPFRQPPPYKRLRGDMLGACSRRINIQHRLVYCVDEAKREVRILRMWTQYE